MQGIVKDMTNVQKDTEKYIFVKRHINNVVKKIHTYDLKDGSVYLYSDGSIRCPIKSSPDKIKAISSSELVNTNIYFTFPLQGGRDGDTYAIIPYEECRKVRALIHNLVIWLY